MSPPPFSGIIPLAWEKYLRAVGEYTRVWARARTCVEIGGVSLVVGTFWVLGSACCDLALRCLGCQVGVGREGYKGLCCIIGENMRVSD